MFICDDCGKTKPEAEATNVQWATMSTGFVCRECSKKYVERPNPVWGGTMHVPPDWCNGCDFYDPSREDSDQCHRDGIWADYCGDTLKRHEAAQLRVQATAATAAEKTAPESE